jgi:hypothetical protein
MCKHDVISIKEVLTQAIGNIYIKKAPAVVTIERDYGSAGKA